MSVLFQYPWEVEAVCPGPPLWEAAQRVPPWARSHQQHARTGLTAPPPPPTPGGRPIPSPDPASLSPLCPQEETGGEVASSPPDSSFQKLAPSETRYTILSRDRDEL